MSTQRPEPDGQQIQERIGEPTDQRPGDAAEDLTPEPDETAGHDGVIDRLRKSAVGTNDPNIVGDAGPLDVPPGHDPDVPPAQLGPAGLPLLPPDEADTAVV